MSTTVSRGIESLDECPPPVRISMIESLRLGPELDAPGSLDPFGRWSEPSTSVVVGENSPGPPLSSAAFALFDAWLPWTNELTRKSTAESTTQPTNAIALHAATFPTVIRLRGLTVGPPAPRPPRPRRSSRTDPPPRRPRRRRGRVR